MKGPDLKLETEAQVVSRCSEKTGTPKNLCARTTMPWTDQMELRCNDIPSSSTHRDYGASEQRETKRTSVVWILTMDDFGKREKFSTRPTVRGKRVGEVLTVATETGGNPVYSGDLINETWPWFTSESLRDTW